MQTSVHALLQHDPLPAALPLSGTAVPPPVRQPRSSL